MQNKSKQQTKQKQVQGIHLHKSIKPKPHWWWNVVARNGRILARSSETYGSKQAAIKSILSAAVFFSNNSYYYDHTKEDVNIVVF